MPRKGELPAWHLFYHFPSFLPVRAAVVPVWAASLPVWAAVAPVWAAVLSVRAAVPPVRTAGLLFQAAVSPP